MYSTAMELNTNSVFSSSCGSTWLVCIMYALYLLHAVVLQKCNSRNGSQLGTEQARALRFRAFSLRCDTWYICNQQAVSSEAWNPLLGQPSELVCKESNNFFFYS